MTEQDPKNRLPHPKGFFSRAAKAFVSVPESAEADPFDDPKLDELLEEKVEEGASEPKLLIIDRLLNRIRVRREV